jgi:hypothetical protein
VSWFPVDDAFHSHPKARRAGMEAVGLWTVSGSFCMAYLTDGFVPEWFVKEKPRGMALAKRLVDAGLWRSGTHDGEEGWWFHDWKPECTKESIEKARTNARLRKQKSRGQQRDEPPPSRVTEHVTDTVTGRVTDASCLGPTQPNPTQPITSVVTSSGGVTFGDARDEPPPCRRHPNGTDAPCGACGARRKWEHDRDVTAKADELHARRTARERADNCPTCHGTNWIPDTDPAVKCTHEVTAHA